MHCRQFDGCTGPVDRSITLITLPAIAIPLYVCILAHLDGTTPGECLAVYIRQQHQVNRRAHGDDGWLFHSTHGELHVILTPEERLPGQWKEWLTVPSATTRQTGKFFVSWHLHPYDGLIWLAGEEQPDKTAVIPARLVVLKSTHRPGFSREKIDGGERSDATPRVSACPRH
jgi:hypothetical protein